MENEITIIDEIVFAITTIALEKEIISISVHKKDVPKKANYICGYKLKKISDEKLRGKFYIKTRLMGKKAIQQQLDHVIKLNKELTEENSRLIKYSEDAKEWQA